MSEQQKPQSSLLKNCLIVGCLMALVGAIGFGAFTWWIANKVGQAFTDDPTKVQELAGRILPGAKAPQGYSGVGGDLFGFSGVVFSATQGEAQPGQADFIIVRLPKTDDVSIEEIRQQMESGMKEGGSNSDQKVLSQETIKLNVGGKPVQAGKLVVEENGKKEDQVVAIFLDKENHMIIVIAEGPSEGFEKAPVQSFFDGLDVSGLQTVDPREIKVEAEPTPAATTEE